MGVPYDMTTQHRPDDALEDFTELIRDEQFFPGGRAPDDPEVQRRRRRSLIVTAVLTIAVLASGGGYTAWAVTAPVADPVATSQVPEAPTTTAATIALPQEGASALTVSGADAYLGPVEGTIWVASGTDDPRPMASITKLITALVVLDAVPLADAADPGPTLAFDSADYALYDKYYVMGASIAEMPRGSSMSLRDAIATMLVPSASNYAEAVSTWAFGSQSAFVGAARRWLAANGLANTAIVEPTGIDPRNTSTPSDLIALGRLAAAHPVVAPIAAMPGITPPGLDGMSNTNALLGTHGITGLKTGTLGESGSNLLYTATFDVGAAAPLSVVGVVLGTSSRDGANHAVVTLLESISAGFTQVPLAEAGEVVGSYATPWGSTADMVIGADASVFHWSDTPITVTMETTEPTEWADGETVGSITWTSGPHAATAPLVIVDTIEPPTTWWRLTHPGDLG